MRRALRALSTVMIATGALVLADAVLTLVWQEPISAYLAHRDQSRLSKQLAQAERRPLALSRSEREALASIADLRRRIAFLARSARRRVKEGDALGRIRIPKVGASFVVVNGTGTADLRKGPGFYPSQPLPGAPGTVAIAGHRTTYLAPFRHIDELRPGNTIRLTMPYAEFTYTVVRTKIVDPHDLAVLDPTGHDTLVLTACHPLYSASKRIVVFSRLTSERARGTVGSRTLVDDASGLSSRSR